MIKVYLLLFFYRFVQPLWNDTAGSMIYAFLYVNAKYIISCYLCKSKPLNQTEFCLLMVVQLLPNNKLILSQQHIAMCLALNTIGFYQ